MFWFFGHKACGILAPEPGIEPAPALEGEFSTTGPPGKSLERYFLIYFYVSNSDFSKYQSGLLKVLMWLSYSI